MKRIILCLLVFIYTTSQAQLIIGVSCVNSDDNKFGIECPVAYQFKDMELGFGLSFINTSEGTVGIDLTNKVTDDLYFNFVDYYKTSTLGISIFGSYKFRDDFYLGVTLNYYSYTTGITYCDTEHILTSSGYFSIKDSNCGKFFIGCYFEYYIKNNIGLRFVINTKDFRIGLNYKLNYYERYKSY